MNSAELPNGLLGELRDTLIDNFGAEDTKGVMRIIKAILLKYWPKNAQQSEGPMPEVLSLDVVGPIVEDAILRTHGKPAGTIQACEIVALELQNEYAKRRGTQQALHPALPQLYERYDLAMKRVAESGLDKRPYWSGEATGLEIAINLLGGTTDDR